MTRCDRVIEGVVDAVELKDESKRFHVGGTDHVFLRERTVHQLRCTIGQQVIRFPLQYATRFYLERGDRVRVAGRIVDDVFVAHALRNLTDDSLYCWKTSGGHYRRTVERQDRMVERMVLCALVPLTLLAAVLEWQSGRPPLSVAGILAGGAALYGLSLWLYRAGVSRALDHSSDHQPGDDATERSAQELLGVSADEATRIIWV